MTPVSVKLNTLTVGSLQRIQNMADKGILAPGRRGVACGAGFVDKQPVQLYWALNSGFNALSRLPQSPE